MKNQQHHQDCPFCKWITNKPEYAIEENQRYLSLANISPDSEGHVLVITKEPRTNITELTAEEWNNLLPLLKSTTNKLTNLLHPIGFNVYSNAGAEGAARQAVFHFHLHVVPEREGNRGVGYLRKPWFIPSEQRYQELEQLLDTQNGIVNQNEQAIAKLVERKQSSDEGHLIITTKKPIKSDLNQIDTETWMEMGKLLRESRKKVVEKLEVKSLRVCLFLGKIGGLKDNSQFQIHLIPRYTAKGAEAKEVIPVPEEVLEVAERLRKAESEVRQEERTKELLAQVEEPARKCWCRIV